MKAKGIVGYLLACWGVPIAVVVVVKVASPDPNRAKETFPVAEFTPIGVRKEEKLERRGADYFELWIDSPGGKRFFHRDPEEGPIDDLDRRFPRGLPVRVTYDPTSEGNVIMEIAPSNPDAEPLVPFESVVEESASRRRFVHIVAGAWFVLANLLAFALWRVEVK